MKKIIMETKDEMVRCSKCGELHHKTTSNCCWISCKCGAEICSECGSENLGQMDIDEDDNEAEYWCCKQCDDCGLTGCAMCI